MARTKKNIELLKIMDEYNLFISSKKRTDMPMWVNKEKANHKSSLYLEQNLWSDSEFGKTSIDCEVRNKNSFNYSFQIISNKIKDRVLVRFDECNGVHRNNNPSIPLQEQEITTPHFHKYDNGGYFIAYKTNELTPYNNKPLNIETGLSIFCNEENIISSDGALINIQVSEEGMLPFKCDEDPLNEIMF